MSIRDILSSWAVWSKLAGNEDDDFVDRLNHIYTVVILVIFALFVGGNACVGDPIACWHPAHFTGAQVQYANSYCWIKNTYYIPMLKSIPVNAHKRKAFEITYYQYVPLILLLMAFMFKIPYVIWRYFSGYSGIELQKTVELTMRAHYVEEGKRWDKINEIALDVDRWLESNRQYHWNCLVRLKQKVLLMCFCLNKREGTYLTGLYIIVKFLYSINVIGQFFLLDAFLGGFFSFWGMEAVYNLAHEQVTKESRRFPRVTLCDFDIRQLQNIQAYTVQCTLPLNLFNEKIFLFLWFWFILVSIVTGFSVLIWIWNSCVRRNKLTIIKKYLKIHSRLQTEAEKKLCKKFAAYLRDDGIFVIRMIQKNSNDILVSDLVTRLWDIYIEKTSIKKSEAAANGALGNNNRQ